MSTPSRKRLTKPPVSIKKKDDKEIKVASEITASRHHQNPEKLLDQVFLTTLLKTDP